MSTYRVGLFAFLLISILNLSGCTKLTKANYDKIEMGMVKSDIEILLGTADSCDKYFGTYTCIWGKEEGRHIKISFIAGRASVFSHDGLE